MTDLSQATPANTNEMPKAPAQGGPQGALGQEGIQGEGVPNGQEPEQGGTPNEEVVPAQEPTPEGDKPPTELPEVKDPEPESTGNEFVDNLLQEFQKHEVDVDKLFGDYLETGNEDSIDFAYLEEKVGKLAAQGLIAGVKAENERLEAKEKADADLIYGAVGGEQVWSAIIEWVGSGESGLTKDGAEAYNKMLAEGGVQAELAASELVKMFKQSPGFTQNAQLQQGDQVAQPTGIEPISRAEYVEKLDEVVRKHGEYSPEAEALHKRREFTLSRGA